MKSFGTIILTIGIAVGIFALFMDTSVQDGYFGRVNNIGLMNKKQNSLITAGVLSIIGVIMITSASRKSGAGKKETFNDTLAKAKKAECVEDYPAALRLYLETIYHLENDYSDKKISEEWNKSRLALIDKLRKKADELRTRKQE